MTELCFIIKHNSVVESEGFREFLNQLDPKFSIPDVYTIKYGALTSLMIEINNKLQKELDRISYCNISLDLWSDAIVRAYNAVICQGINDDWELQVLPIAFQHIPGSHTNDKIKKQYDEILCNFNLQENIYKIITDQASNMKSAFGNITEKIFPIPQIYNKEIDDITRTLLEDLNEREKCADRNVLLDQCEEIDSTCSNRSSPDSNCSQLSTPTSSNVGSKISDFFPGKFNREKAVQFALELDDLSEKTFDEKSQELDDTLLDVDDGEEDAMDSLVTTTIMTSELAYIPCLAHNLQLVLKDSFIKCNDDLDSILNKCTKFVTKCRNSTHIAEELRSFGKTLQKSVVTRWNSYLFVIRSINKLTKTEMNKLFGVIDERDKKIKKFKY